jgi:hypothetical protein
MAASKNAFFSNKLSCHKKTDIMQIMTKILKFHFINLLLLRNCETRSFYDSFHELCKHRFVTQPLQNLPFCSSTVSFVAFCFLAFQPFLAENWLYSLCCENRYKIISQHIHLSSFYICSSLIHLYLCISHSLCHFSRLSPLFLYHTHVSIVW